METFEAVDGVEALTKLQEQKADAIISDILMPRMDGYRFCQEVRKRKSVKDTPFIFYTSTYTSASDEKLALDCGADRFIMKPAPMRLVIEAIRELINPDARACGTRRCRKSCWSCASTTRPWSTSSRSAMPSWSGRGRRSCGSTRASSAAWGTHLRAGPGQPGTRSLQPFHRARFAFPAHGHRRLQQRPAQGMRGPPSPEAMEHLQFICKATRRMNDLTSDLLRLARASRAQIRRETVDLSMIARGIFQDCGNCTRTARFPPRSPKGWSSTRTSRSCASHSRTC